MRVLRVADHCPVHRVHIQPSSRVRRQVLGHTLPDGLLHQLQHQNRSQYVRNIITILRFILYIKA